MFQLFYGNISEEYFSKLSHSSYTKVFNETAKTMLKKWKKMLGQPIEVFSDVSLMTLDSMLRCAMSTETDCQHARYGYFCLNVIFSFPVATACCYSWCSSFISS